MKVSYSTSFTRAFKTLTRKNKLLRHKTQKQLAVFLENPKRHSLRLHKLTGKRFEQWSISIDQDIRLIFQYIPEGILLVDIGSHDEVY